MAAMRDEKRHGNRSYDEPGELSSHYDHRDRRQCQEVGADAQDMRPFGGRAHTIAVCAGCKVLGRKSDTRHLGCLDTRGKGHGLISPAESAFLLFLRPLRLPARLFRLRHRTFSPPVLVNHREISFLPKSIEHFRRVTERIDRVLVDSFPAGRGAIRQPVIGCFDRRFRFFVPSVW